MLRILSSNVKDELYVKMCYSRVKAQAKTIRIRDLANSKQGSLTFILDTKRCLIKVV